MSVFIQKLQKYAQAKNLDKQKELAETLIELSESDQKALQDDLTKIIASQDDNLQFSFVEILFWTRMAQEKEIDDWNVIDLVAYPAFGSFKNLCLNPTICAAVAKIIVRFCKQKSSDELELIEEIQQLITQANNEMIFYGLSENTDSEQAIYDVFLPAICDEK